ncbi:MAG: peptide deformylase [Alphaproteobacteria bacterium]
MAILKIARMGHPVLLRPAETVVDPTAPEIHALIDDMLETMIDADGLGLAAPQVHVSKRVVIFRTPGTHEAGAEENAWSNLTVLINPVVEPLDEAREDGWEGCLSVPGLRGLVSRYGRVGYRGLGLDGGVIEREAEGLHARVVQHECDHLDGALYPMRMTDLSQLVFESEIRHRPVRTERDPDAGQAT